MALAPARALPEDGALLWCLPCKAPCKLPLHNRLAQTLKPELVSAGLVDNSGSTCGQVGRQVAKAVAGLVQLHAQRVVLRDRAPWEAPHLLPTTERARWQACSNPS